LVGVGRSHLMGKINMTENVIRCLISIALVRLNQPVTDIIWVFVLTRWLVAIYGFVRLKKIFSKIESVQAWHVDPRIFHTIAHEAPKFALIIGAFLLLRNAGLLMLPALSNAEQTALHAVCYQLFDLILVVPSVLAMTSINAFANKANASNAALKKSAIQLISITSMALFPLIAIAAGFGQQILHMFYGDKYLHGQHTLIVMMIAAGMMVIDQVLSQVMQAKKMYREDMTSIVTGGLTTLIFTPTLCLTHGALGAAFAMVFGIFFTIAARFVLLKKIFTTRLLWLSVWKQSFMSLFIFFLVFGLLRLEMMHKFAESPFLWLLIVPIVLLAYGVGIFMMGCLKKSQIYRMRQFLFHH
jgi:O-antigen/teichoic acid export membrane protein